MAQVFLDFLVHGMSDQEEFVKGLLEVYGKQPLPFSDFTIDCEDGQVEAHRLILALRSKYFDALFRQEGNEVRSLSVPQFNCAVMFAIVKSLIVADVEAIEQAGCKEVLQAADYFQIKHLTQDVSKILQEKITEENFIEYAEVADMFNADTLADFCATFGQRKLATFQKHMELGSFHALPKSVLFKLFRPKKGMIDHRQRPLDIIETQLYLLNMIYSILQDTGRLDDLKECLLVDKCFMVEALCVFLNDGTDSELLDENCKYIIPEPKRREELHKNLLMLGVGQESHEGVLETRDLDQIKCFVQSRRFGEGEPVHQRPNIPVHYIKYYVHSWPFGQGEPVHQRPRDGDVKWEIRGDIRAIEIKTRLWDNRNIIQGFKVELSDGTQKAVGMELNDTLNVTSFSIDSDDHIVGPFTLRSGWYIDKIEFRTKKGQLLGPIGGEGGEDRGSQFMNRKENSYLWRIEGWTAITQGAPCIYAVRFHYFKIPTGDSDNEKDYM